jgi:hypothetical protein
MHQVHFHPDGDEVLSVVLVDETQQPCIPGRSNCQRSIRVILIRVVLLEDRYPSPIRRHRGQVQYRFPKWSLSKTVFPTSGWESAIVRPYYGAIRGKSTNRV